MMGAATEALSGPDGTEALKQIDLSELESVAPPLGYGRD